MAKIVHRGTLTIEKLKELCYEHLDLKSDSDEWNPKLDPNIITLKKQDDGNWKGYTIKNGILIESREQMPEHALLKLQTMA